MDTDTEWVSDSFNLALADLGFAMMAGGSSVVVVLGAGASVEAGVPMGPGVEARLGGALSPFTGGFDRGVALERALGTVRSRLPFNPTETLGRLIADVGIPTTDSFAHTPTLLHLLVARMVQAGVVPLVVSLNFDEILERCLRAEMGPPVDLASLAWEASDVARSPAVGWVSLSETADFEIAEQLVDHPPRSSLIQCALLKPHGTISRRRLVAAEQDVQVFPAPVRRMLVKVLESDGVHVLFLGCSLRDSDFRDLFSAATVKARITVFGVDPPAQWVHDARAALGEHPFDGPTLANTPIVYVHCDAQPRDPCVDGQADAVSDTEAPHKGTRLTARARMTPGQALLRVLRHSSEATGNLQVQNAPNVSDVAIHDWLRHHQVGRRPGPEVFAASEILIAAAHNNGVFTREALVKARGHLRILREQLAPLVDEVFARFERSPAFVPFRPSREGHPRFALRALGGDACRAAIRDAVGPFRMFEGHDDELVKLLVDLAEFKARRSTWQMRAPVDLVTIERGTALVLETTDELLVVSEYGTWMRRDRFVADFTSAYERGRAHGRRVEVVVAEPPPAESQGYREWVTSAAWLARLAGLSLSVLDVDDHTHHMTLGEQVGIDFDRSGTQSVLLQASVRLRSSDRHQLYAKFEQARAKAEGFGAWHLRDGLRMKWHDVAVRYLVRMPLDRVVLVHDARLDLTARGPVAQAARVRWEAENARRAREGLPALEARRLFRPMAARLGDERLTIDCGKTTYFDNYALATATPGWEPDRITGAGISVVPVCKGGILLGERSRVVAEGPRLFHVVGGHAHPTPRFATSPEGLTRGALQELAEEMAIGPSDIETLEFLGLVLNCRTAKPEFITVAQLKEDDPHFYIERWQASHRASGEEPSGRRRQPQAAPAELPEFTRLVTFDALYKEATDASAPFSVVTLGRIREHLVVAGQGALLMYALSDPRVSLDHLESQLS